MYKINCATKREIRREDIWIYGKETKQGNIRVEMEDEPREGGFRRIEKGGKDTTEEGEVGERCNSQEQGNKDRGKYGREQWSE